MRKLMDKLKPNILILSSILAGLALAALFRGLEDPLLIVIGIFAGVLLRMQEKEDGEDNN